MKNFGFGMAICCLVSFVAGMPVFAKTVSVDFGKEFGRIRPELHSSGYSTLMHERGVLNARVKEMNFHAVRTHDLALLNGGARVVDNHFIFPIEHLDATDPKNYCFGPTDYLLELQRKMGLKIFYRLGTSIETTGLKHFNALIPKDFDKVSENFAATIRHYNRGWANGYKWNIKYWEIWNEPDGHNTMWCADGKDDHDEAWDVERRELYVKFFVTAFNRIKREFPEVRVGGPVLCAYKEDYLRAFLSGCRAAGVRPDFLSWHSYARDPEIVLSAPEKAKKLCSEFGLGDVEFIIDEWHYLPKGEWNALRSPDKVVSRPANVGPGSVVGIDSACYTLTTLIGLQRSGYAQAYFYGCRHTGPWGFKDQVGDLNKVFFALRNFGEIVRDYSSYCAATSDCKNVVAFPVVSKDGRKAVLVVDYLGSREDITLDVRGVDGDPTVSVLSDAHDFLERPVVMGDGKIVLTKPDAHSVAFFVSFEVIAKPRR